MNRYTTGKYIKSEEALYGVLHKKHPDIARASFEITVSSYEKMMSQANIMYFPLVFKRSLDVQSPTKAHSDRDRVSEPINGYGGSGIANVVCVGRLRIET